MYADEIYSRITYDSAKYIPMATIAGNRGDTSQNGSPTLSKDMAGAGFTAFDAGLSFKFALPVGKMGSR